MELKKFNEYKPEEKKELLLHWWHYYGKLMYTFEELEQFKEMIDKNIREVFMIAVGGYTIGVTSQPIILSMRNGKIDDLRASLPDLEGEGETFKRAIQKVETKLLTELVRTYNNPEPSVPLDYTNYTILASIDELNKDGNGPQR